MKNRMKEILALSASALLLASCQTGGSSESSQFSKPSDSLDSSVSHEIASSSSSESSESTSISESDDITREGWDEEDKALLLKYCGEILPYPAGFLTYATVNEVKDDEGTLYLEIVNSSLAFTIDDYYVDLEKEGWTGIRDYNGNIAQSDSSGTTYYELTHVSPDGKTGYDLTYYFYGPSYSDDPCNVIRCYNDMDVSLDSSTEWKKSTKESFEQVLTVVPAKFKLGATNEVYASTEDNIAAYDSCAIDLTKDNVKILQEDGWVLDDAKSKEYSSWVLRKEATDGAPVYASVYYFFGNRVSFSYYYDIHESETWPSEFASAFEKKTGFAIPQFTSDDIEKYYYCTKKGVCYIYADTDSDLSSDYEDSMAETNAVFDDYYRWYTDWSETWYVKAGMTIDYASYGKAFMVSFATLDEPYDDIVTGWPSEKISTFLTSNGINGINVPSFDFSSYSDYQTCRVDALNYNDAYDEIYEEIVDDPDYYNVDDPTDEDEISAKAKRLAKDSTKIKIKIHDGEKGNSSAHKAYDYLASAFKKMGWAKVSSYAYDVAYEDSTGAVLIGLSHYFDVTTITITYGSGSQHVASFHFKNTDVNIKPGETYALDIICDLLVGEVTYSSDNDKFTVDSNGVVTASKDAVAGDEATITATILAEGETTPRTTTARVSVAGVYNSETGLKAVAALYNNYFKLTSADTGYAVPVANADGTYTLNVHPTSFTTVKETESFVMENLIPEGYGNACSGEWSKETSTDGTTYETTNFIVCNDDKESTMFQLTFKVYADETDGTIGIIVESLPY